MKKHLFITLDYAPNIGGVSTYLAQLCAQFEPEHVFVLAENSAGAQAYDSKQKYYIQRTQVDRRWWQLFKPAWQLITDKSISTIHVSHILPIGYLALIFKLLLGKQYVLYLHGLDFNNTQKKWHKRQLARLIINNAQNIIVNSQFTQNLVLNKFPQLLNISIIEPCPNENLHKQKVNQAVIKKYKPNTILLTVARLVKRKGHIKVLKFLAENHEAYPGIKYIIIGDGPEKKVLQSEIAQSKLEGLVEIIGRINDQDLVSYYQSADIFVMPNDSFGEDVEGFGISFLEANSFGLPVIGGNNGGVTEAILHNQTGLLVSNQQELTDALHKLLIDRELRKKLGSQGAQRVQKQFTWQQQYKKLLTILK
jgi:phosphatidylinositol alpha-1,6-mannosyltransferase